MSNLIKLQPCDDLTMVFEVPREILLLSKTLADMLIDVGGECEYPIPLSNVNAAVLSKVVIFCTHYLETTPVKTEVETKTETETETDTEKTETPETKVDEFTEWEKAFCAIDQTELFEVILAANYLDIKPLLDLTCRTVANMIKGKSPEEIRKTFNIVNDFTPEEEEKIRKENEWCEDK